MHATQYRWHHDFDDGPLDSDRLLDLIDEHYRNWRLTRSQTEIAAALLRRYGVDGRCSASAATAAAVIEDIPCSLRSVERAFNRLRAVGLLVHVP